MTTALAKTLNALPAMNRIHRWPLSKCLGAIGAPRPERKACGDKINANRIKAQPAAGFGKLAYWQLHDLYVECKKIWIQGCKAIQTQFTENHEAAAKWNALWTRLEQLFKRKGIMA